MKKINNIFNTANKSLFAIGDTSRRSTPDSSGQRKILLSSCRGPISPLARGVPARAGCRKFGVWFAALVALFVATPSFAEPTELDKKTVASKAYVDTKQDIIETGNIVFIEDLEGTGGDIYVPGLVAYDPQTNALSGNKIGILDYETIRDDQGDLSAYSGDYVFDEFVPTVRAVAEELAYKQDKLPAASASTTNASDMASTGGQTIVLTPNAGVVGTRYITAGGSQPLTKKSGADNVILYINGTKTLAQYQTSNFGAAGGTATTYQNYIKGALVSLELLKDVYSELNAKITNNALPTGTTGTVVTYNGTNQQTGVQQFTETAISGTATYDDNDQLTNGNNIANVSLVETEIATRQKKRTCAGYEPGHENEADYCWLWNFPD